MQDQVARFVAELRVALAREGIKTFGGGWSIDPPIGSESWSSMTSRARHVMRLGFGEAECAHAIEATGGSARSLWPEDSLELGALRLTLVHIQEELDTRVNAEKYVVLTFPDGMAQVRPDREPGQRR
jgi:hypothetical protein